MTVCVVMYELNMPKYGWATLYTMYSLNRLQYVRGDMESDYGILMLGNEDAVARTVVIEKM